MILVSRPSQVNAVSKVLSEDGRWCYLGKNVAARRKISGSLGEERRFFLTERLHGTAIRLRQPFLDFIAGLGRKQCDSLIWWASRFASKSPFQTDFFLLVCYKALAMELIRGNNSEARDLAIFVEDPWLFGGIARSLGSQEARFFGSSGLRLCKWLSLVKGITYRLLVPCWFLAARTLAAYYHAGRRPGSPDAAEPAVSILSFAEERAFKDGSYVDNYIPGLAEFCEEKRIPFFYLYSIPFPLSTARHLRKNRDVLWPLILDGRLGDVVKRCFFAWRLDPGNSSEQIIGEVAVPELLEREEWFEFASPGFTVRLVLFDAVRHFFERRWTHVLVYVFENQPWEKLVCMAAHAAGVRTVGYQHSSIWELYLSQFPGRGEAAYMPLPDRLLTAGPHFATIYREHGIPEELISTGGAWRYLRLLERQKQTGRENGSNTGRPIVLLALPVDVSISTSLLENFLGDMSGAGPDSAREVWIKPHPDVPLSRLNMEKDLVGRCRVVTEPFEKLLDQVDVVVTSASTAGLEAFFADKKVVSYVPENLLAADPLLEIKDERIYTWYEGRPIDAGFLGSALPSERKSKALEEYFSRIDPDAWLDCLRP